MYVTAMHGYVRNMNNLWLYQQTIEQQHLKPRPGDGLQYLVIFNFFAKVYE